MSPSLATSAAPRPPRATRAQPPWLAAFRDLPREHGFEPLEVEGVLPPGLVGTLYRNGPGLLSSFGERYRHWFDADGAVTAVRLTSDGRALGAARVVQTRGLIAERRAGRRLYGSYDTPMARPIRELFLGESKNPANTSVMFQRGRLLALCEAGKPVEIDPGSLATRGETDLGGAVIGAFSAHPHAIAARGATYNFGQRVGRRAFIDLYELPARGAARRLASVQTDGPSFVHDFVATDRHLVLVLAPVHMSLWSLLRKRGPMSSATWRPGRGTEIVVVPIDDPARVTRFRVPAFVLEHTANAYEVGGAIHFDFTHYESPDGLERAVRGLVRGEIEAAPATRLARGTLDPARRTLRIETVADVACELPRVAGAVESRRHRFVYAVAHMRPEAARLTPFDALVKIDVATGAVARISLGVDRYPSEAVFVARPDPSAEDDGWLLSLVYDVARDASFLAVLDARDPSGIVAKAWMNHHVPPGFHGIWREGA
jgi:all-trans-8'-apo-beta-carotenal 15,15'-oxygenase